MSRPRALVTGAAGQVGAATARALMAAGWVVTATRRSDLDIGDRQQVLAAAAALRPDVVVNAAAFTDVDACEADPDRAYRDNALAVRHLAEASRRVGAHLVHLSTDYVFAGGDLDRPYHEWDEPRPLSVYGRSKRAGELEAGPTATVVRTSWVFSPGGHNLVLTVLRLLAEPGREPRFVTDQESCPTSADDLAATLVRLATDRRPGTFHVTNAGRSSPFDWACLIAERSGHDPARIRPVTLAEVQPSRPAPRPRRSSLDGAALRLSNLPPLRHHAEALDDVLDQIRS